MKSLYIKYEIHHAIFELRPNSEWHMNGSDYNQLVWHESNTTEKPTLEEINAKINELNLAEPMRILREERNQRLEETDWWGLKETDGRMMTQEQKDYRNALRDLPSTSTPSLDSYGNLENVTWPVKPE